MNRDSSSLLTPGLLLLFAIACSSLTLFECSSAVAQQNRKQTTKSKLPNQDKKIKRNVNVAKVSPNTRPQVLESAKTIDDLVLAKLRQEGLAPNPITKDSQFVRRVYLDITGTIPTLNQTREFLNSRDKEKRIRLIDQLLNSPGYASHNFNYWADLLRIKDRLQGNVPGQPYVEWVHQSLLDNMPYDEFVTRMLVAEGKIWDDPAAGYLLRDVGMPLDNLNNTIRIFLGTQIGCAQCHDDPFDKWTQRDFYQLAAFVYGTRTRVNPKDYGDKNNTVQKVKQEVNKMGLEQREMNMFNRLVRYNNFGVKSDAKQKLKFPHDYSYDDAKPGEVVHPKTIFGENPEIDNSKSGREVFANWLTSKDNERFALTIANRMWKRSMGRGVIEPVDQMNDDTVADIPELMDFLESEMKRLDFDLKEFQRIIFNSQTYQRQATTETPEGDEPYYFQGPLLRRMTAEQVWDSLLTLALYNPNAYEKPSFEEVIPVIDLNPQNLTAKKAIDQAMQLDEKISYKATADVKRSNTYKGLLLARASELPSPLPPGHFIRQFGQGDRELIESSNTDGSVPQLLSMFNGQVTHIMLERGSVIYDNVVAARSLTEQIEVIFYSVLSRLPSAAHRAVALRELQHGKGGHGNVIWALINTREFLFIP